MNNQNHFSIIGTGAVGGYYGGLLQHAGFDVHFLVNSDYDHVKQHGLKIDSVNGNFALPEVNAYTDPRDMPKCDIVILALKTTANHVLKDILPHVVGENSMVLTLQNGLGSEEEIADIIGSENILGGLCFLCSNKIAPGHINHVDYGLITLGEYRADGEPGGISKRLKKVDKQLQSAGITTQMVEDLAAARWRKLVWNIPFNGMSVARNCLTDKLIGEPQTCALCKKLMQETAAASEAVCRPIESEFIEKMLIHTEKMEPYAPSMKLDFDRGNPMEIEAIYGNPIRAAEKAGVDMPETRKLYEELKILNSIV